jgi:uncharacterized protein Yka (UPF0111/DUF47 family)
MIGQAMQSEAEIIQTNPASRFSRIINTVFPRTPDFYSMLNDQCDVVAQAMEILVTYMQTGEQKRADDVRRLEHEGDILKLRNIDVLNRSFSTPFDREDIYRAITSIDEGLNYAKTTVREMEILGIEPDNQMLEMAKLLQTSARELQGGFAALKKHPAKAEQGAAAVQKAERQVEKLYRKAISQLFDAKYYAANPPAELSNNQDDFLHLLDPLKDTDCRAAARGLAYVMEVLKRREIYRHLSNASDHFAHAGDILHNIIVKTA